MFYIGIVGSRRRSSRQDKELIAIELQKHIVVGDTIIISGGCPSGADRFAEELAKFLQIPILIYYAEWRRLGKSAGIQRNTHIARHSNILIACVAEDRKGGTEDTVRKFIGFHSEEDLYLV